jgi:Rad3-related DNA helicase
MMINPKTLNLPHDELRPNQGETIEWLLESDSRVHVAQCPVGAGKSAIAAALGSQDRSVLTVTSSKSLQDQYAGIYNFAPLKGLGSYSCALNPLFNANMCVYMPKMFDCTVHSECTYLIQREQFKNADRRSLNYAFFFLANWVRELDTNWIVLDEAHKLPRLIMDFMTLSLTPKDVFDLDLPLFPTKPTRSNEVRLRLIANWLDKCYDILIDKIGMLQNKKRRMPKQSTGGIVAHINRLNSLSSQFQTTKASILNSPDEWFSTMNEYELKVAPLSARKLFKPFFLDGFSPDTKFLLMSATIGRHELFAKSLGIESYVHRDVPSNFPPESRSIHVLNTPRMGHSTATALSFDKQAKAITNAIRRYCHPNWSGLIHVNSKKKANDLVSRLSIPFKDRVYIVQGQGTDGKLAGWSEQKASKRNSICISYSFDEGVDLGDENFCISADVPFAYLGDPIERARMDYDNILYRAEAANKLEQRSGRIRRGKPEHYDLDGQRNGFVAIADANWKMVESELSDDFKACLRFS